MEILSILVGIVFWPSAIAVWVFVCRKRNVRRGIAWTGLVVLVTLPMVCAASLGRWMFLDEPLAIAAMDGNSARVRHLLRLGANPNADLEGQPALQQAADAGHTEVVRLLLAHGARVDVEDNWSHRTPLQSARAKKHWDIVRLLQRAGAKE